MLPPQIDLRARTRIPDDRSRPRLSPRIGRRAEPQRNRNHRAGAARTHRHRGQAGARGSGSRKLPGGEAAAARLLRARHLEAQRNFERRKPRTQKIVAWNASPNAAIARSNGHAPTKPKPASAMCSPKNAARLPLLKSPSSTREVSRASIERMIRQGKLKCWEEPRRHRRRFVRRRLHAAIQYFEPGSGARTGAIRGKLDSQRRTLPRVSFTASPAAAKRKCILGASRSGARAKSNRHRFWSRKLRSRFGCGRLCRARFGEGVAVLHSALPEVERAREWWRVRRGEARVVVGTRSAVFAPVENLGLDHRR